MTAGRLRLSSWRSQCRSLAVHHRAQSDLLGADVRLVLSSDMTRITQIIDQLCGMFTSTTTALHSRNGGMSIDRNQDEAHKLGLIGLAATAIALGQDFSPFLGTIIPPILSCFQDPESRLRYHACESLYNMSVEQDFKQETG